MVVPLDGVVCRILLYTAACFSSANQVTLEFSTGSFQGSAANSLLFCFNDTLFPINQATIYSLLPGGGLFTSSSGTNDIFYGRAPLSSGSAYNLPPFFNPSTSLLPIETGLSVQDVLGTDGYYSSSYQNARYDDFQYDSSGQSIAGVASSNAFVPPGNCMLVTGAWAKNTRYQMTVGITNPDRGDRPSTPPFPSMWMLPLAVASVAGPVYKGGYQPTNLVFTALGNKYGSACPIRTVALPALSTMFDACYEAEVLHLQPLPPTNLSASDRAVTSCSGSDAVLSTAWYGGQCISCGSGSVDASSSASPTCSCRPNTVTLLAGVTACGPAVVVSGVNASTTVGLGPALCQQYTAIQNQWSEGNISDVVVVGLLLQAFALQAAPLLGPTTITTSNATFYANYIDDQRIPYSPTRQHGIKPNCNRCHAGTFNNSLAGKAPAPVYDNRFGAINTFRLIGYILNSVLTSSCPALWDPNNPLQWKYGFYQNVLCKAIPATG